MLTSKGHWGIKWPGDTKFASTQDSSEQRADGGELTPSGKVALSLLIPLGWVCGNHTPSCPVPQRACSGSQPAGTKLFLLGFNLPSKKQKFQGVDF